MSTRPADTLSGSSAHATQRPTAPPTSDAQPDNKIRAVTAPPMITSGMP